MALYPNVKPPFACCLYACMPGPLKVCKENTAFIRSLLETKEFPIKIASCNIECQSPNATWYYFIIFKGALMFRINCRPQASKMDRH